jgi:hypothetical protein
VPTYANGAPGPYIVDSPGGYLHAGLVPAGVALVALAVAMPTAARGARIVTGRAGSA